MSSKFLGIVDADSILYRVAYVTEDETFEMAKDTLRAFIYENIHKQTQCENYVFCFSGKQNFRKLIDQEYKGNRKDSVKPKHLEELREYAIEEYCGLVIEPYEADDVVIAIADRYIGSFVLIGIDKDAYQLAGTHFNFVKHTWREVSPLEAQYNLAVQMLMGDSTDNIKGIPKIGEVKAKKMLDASHLPPMLVVYDQYKEKGLIENGYYGIQNQLLRMQKDILVSTDVESHFLSMSVQDLNVAEEFNFE